MSAASTRGDAASPVILALLACGGFIVLSAMIFLSPFVLSPNAMQNDVYMSNLFLSPPWFVLGGVLVLAGLLIARAQGRHVQWVPGLLLAGAGAVVLALLYVLVGGHYTSVGAAVNWPPYLNETMLGVTLTVAMVEFIIGGAWGTLTQSHQHGQVPART